MVTFVGPCTQEVTILVVNNEFGCLFFCPSPNRFGRNIPSTPWDVSQHGFRSRGTFSILSRNPNLSRNPPRNGKTDPDFEKNDGSKEWTRNPPLDPLDFCSTRLDPKPPLFRRSEVFAGHGGGLGAPGRGARPHPHGECVAADAGREARGALGRRGGGGKADAGKIGC